MLEHFFKIYPTEPLKIVLLYNRICRFYPRTIFDSSMYTLENFYGSDSFLLELYLTAV